MNAKTVLMRRESDSDFSEFDYDGEIEFNDKNEMIIKFKDLEYSNLEKWNGNYYISRK